MNAIRTLTSTQSGVRRLLLSFSTALLLIAGLLAMHTLTGTLTIGHADTEPAVAVEHAAVAQPAMNSSTAHAERSILAPSSTAPDSPPAHCAGCGDPAGAPDHSMLMMACVLALLAAVIVLLAPMLLSRLGATLALTRLHARAVPATAPHPRPPSLIVLSISRT